MSKRDRSLMFLLTLVGGALGGGVTHLLLRGEVAFAQKRPAPPPVAVNAEEFRLIDRQNREHAVLSIADGRATLALRDASGAPRVVMDASGALRLLNASGRPALALGSKDGAGELIVYDAAGKQNVLSKLKVEEKATESVTIKK